MRNKANKHVCDPLSEHMSFQQTTALFVQIVKHIRHKPPRDHCRPRGTRGQLAAGRNCTVEMLLLPPWVTLAKKRSRTSNCIWTGGRGGEKAATVKDVVRSLKNCCVCNTAKQAVEETARCGGTSLESEHLRGGSRRPRI